jgi:uncharacterized protein
MEKISSPVLPWILSTARRLPMAAYLIFGVGFAWLIWLASAPAVQADPTAFRHLVAIGAFSPSLAALAIGLMQTQLRRAFRWDIFVGALFATGILYFLCLPFASSLPTDASSWGWTYRFGLWALPAFLIAAAFSAPDDLRHLLLPARFQSSDLGWYAAAILVIPILMGLGYFLGMQRGETAPLQLKGGPGEVALTVGAVFIYILLFGGPLGEESGLRGFLLPRLQARWSPLIATLLIGLGWAVWRLPLYLNGFYLGDTGGLLGGLLFRSLFNLLSAFPLTWLYNRSRGNILACILLHSAITTASVLLPVDTLSLLPLGVLAIVLIVEARMWNRS